MTDTKRAERKRTRGFATKAEERTHRMRQRVHQAATAEAQLCAAFDWFRSAASRVDSEGARSSLMGDMAATLTNAAAQIEEARP